jgi:hypothetical protein
MGIVNHRDSGEGSAMADSRPWYEVLGVPPSATDDEIRVAYRGLVRTWHPDRFAGQPALAARAEERTKEINAAYEDARAWARSWSSAEEWAVWADGPEPAAVRLLVSPHSLGVRAIALMLALLFTFFAVAQTMNALDLALR